MLSSRAASVTSCRSGRPTTTDAGPATRPTSACRAAWGSGAAKSRAVAWSRWFPSPGVQRFKVLVGIARGGSHAPTGA